MVARALGIRRPLHSLSPSEILFNSQEERVEPCRVAEEHGWERGVDGSRKGVARRRDARMQRDMAAVSLNGDCNHCRGQELAMGHSEERNNGSMLINGSQWGVGLRACGGCA